MESYSQPWTMVNKYESAEQQPKCSYESYYGPSIMETASQKKPNQWQSEWNSAKISQLEIPSYYNSNNSLYEKYTAQEKMHHQQHSEKPTTQWYQQHCEKPSQYHQQQTEKTYCQTEKSMPERFYMKQMEGVYGDWEKICDNLEQMKMEKKNHHHSYQQHHETGIRGQWNNCESNKCCDEEMIKLVKDMINSLIGAEQSYIQLGFLCMDEMLTLTNTAEYFRLCGLRMRWLAHGLIARSVRLFNVNEWINNTTFENWFKVPTKEELTTNDYTNVIKTFFKISMEAEERLVEKMHRLGEKMTKVDWMNTECRFEGFKWFINFVLPYQMHFVREMNMHLKNIEMCNNGYIFDKCEMRPLVQKIEEFIHRLVKSNSNIWTNNKCEKMVIVRKNY